MRLARLRLEHLRHQVDEGAVGVELLRRVAAVVGELLDEVLVAVAELVLGHGRRGSASCFEKCSIRFFSVASGSCALSVQAALPKTPGRRSGLAASMARKAFSSARPTSRGGSAHVVPVRAVGDREAVVGGGGRRSPRRRSRRGPAGSSSSHTSESRLKKSSGKMYCL